jgi:5-methylcytosine-specific restriction endonuclease McrA
MQPVPRGRLARKAPLKKGRPLPYDYDQRLADLYLRDKGICQLCHRPVEWRLRSSFFHPGRPSIDHKEAKARGGAKYAVSNQQLSHLRCNQQKGVKTMRQVRAIQNPQSKVLRKRGRLGSVQPSAGPASLAELLRGR